MKQKVILLGFAILLCLSACGKKDIPTAATVSTTENTTEITTEYTTQAAESTTAEIVLPPEQSINKNGEIVTFAEPYTNPSPDDSFVPNASGSPIQNVNGKLYNEVSTAVRSYANESYMNMLADKFAENKDYMVTNTEEMAAMRVKWLNQTELRDDEAFAENGYRLIFAYSQMAKCKLLYEGYNEHLSEKDKALYADILNDLEANTEIFLNMENISAVTDNNDFTCNDRIQQFLTNITKVVK